MDVWGEPKQVSEEHLLATLRALTGLELDSEHAIDSAISSLRNRRDLIEPVIVAWDGWFPETSLARAVSSAYLVTDQGDEVPVAIDDRSITIDSQLPLGYHHLHVAGATQSTMVIAAPQKAPAAPQRSMGVLAPVYSMRSQANDTGIGNLGHLGQLADMALVTGTRVIGTLPLVATFPDQPSPYAPASRRAWNELFVDLPAAPGWHGELPTYEGDPLWTDYELAGPPIRAQLAAYAQWALGQPQLRSQIDEFAASNPEIAHYAQFRAICDSHGRNWRAWASDAVGTPEREAYHLVGQWLAALQLRDLSERLSRRGQYLYLDLPIGCHPDGYDIWDQPELYAPASVGAPPDSLFLGGQEWGLPAVIPARARQNHHKTYITAVRHQLSVAGILRVDHVMGLHRAWWVPHGLEAIDGAYVLQPTDEMFAILCLESHRAQSPVIGENLGTVPEAVSHALEKHRLLGMKVALDGLNEPTDSELIALATHDTPPFAAWWEKQDIDDGEDLGVYTDDRGNEARRQRNQTLDELQARFATDGLAATRDAILEWMAGSDAAVAILNIDDLWAENRRQNVPGTDRERPNWRARHAVTMEDLMNDTAILSQLEHLCELRNTAHDGSDEEMTGTE